MELRSDLKIIHVVGAALPDNAVRFYSDNATPGRKLIPVRFTSSA
jgi:hypothetical protein